MSFDERTFHPISLKAPPKPSHFCAAEPSLTVTVAVPLAASVHVPVFQYAPDAEVTRTVDAVVAPPAEEPPPAPVVPPGDAPPAPVFPPAAPLAPLLPAAPPAAPPAALPPEPALDVPPPAPPLEVPVAPPLEELPPAPTPAPPPLPPLEVPVEPPLELPAVPPESVTAPPEPLGGVLLDPELQAAKRTAIPTPVIDFCALFIAPTSLKAPLARGSTARHTDCVVYMPLVASWVAF
jgi:hypothetical protein